MHIYRIVSVILVSILLINGSVAPPGDAAEQARAFTRAIEFDYGTWMLDALAGKALQSAVRSPQYLTTGQQQELVESNIDLVEEINRLTAEIERIYADPNISNPAQAAAAQTEDLEELRTVESQLQPVSEAVLQQQVSRVLAENDLTLAGQPVPPVLFQTTPLPVALIISPRNVIQQDANISLVAELTLPEIVALEQAVEEKLNVSALVVEIGGVGVYPTMIMSTTNLSWLVEVIAHEWAHNYLTLRPLGLNYETNGELRTMNETTASIVGKEIGQLVLAEYYPQLLPAPPAPTPLPTPTAMPESTPLPTPTAEPPRFDFRAEMHETRVTADKLLAEGKIQEAEAYMEARRVFLWENGYQIRRLNQAYFAFHGAYADTPGGAAGEDPVGPAVRALRAQSTSLADFLKRIAWMTSFEQLQEAVAQ